MEARRLIIMRHATADSGGGRDQDRNLTPQGQDDARRVGLSIRSRGPIPERVLCSSAVRCRQTWQALSSSIGSTAAIDFEDTLYNASSESLLHSLAGVVDERTVLLLAHNPGVSHLALELAHRDEASVRRLRAGFTPAAIACFEIDAPWSLLSPASARLTRFERASQN